MKTRDLLPPTLATLALSLLLVGFCMYVTVRPSEIKPRPASKKSSPGVASVSFIEGQAEIRSLGGVWTPVQRGDLLLPGDAIRTGVNGRMELRLREEQGLASPAELGRPAEAAGVLLHRLLRRRPSLSALRTSRRPLYPPRRTRR